MQQLQTPTDEATDEDTPPTLRIDVEKLHVITVPPFSGAVAYDVVRLYA